MSLERKNAADKNKHMKVKEKNQTKQEHHWTYIKCSVNTKVMDIWDDENHKQQNYKQVPNKYRKRQ